MPPTKISERVRYSRAFLLNTGQYTGRMAFLRGRITEIDKSGLASIAWDDGTLGKVLTGNLSLEGQSDECRRRATVRAPPAQRLSRPAR